MTLDPKALEAAHKAYRSSLEVKDAITAYLAALPLGDLAGLVERLRNWPWEVGDDGQARLSMDTLEKDCQEAAEALTALVGGWREISTAPRDGTQILGWNEEGHEIVEWMDAQPDGPDQPGNDEGWVGVYAFPGRDIDDRYHSQPQGQPTHWMPFPAPPEDG